MNETELFIPPRTLAEIASPAAPGERHAQAMRVAVPLIGNGLSPDAVFAQLRSMYPEDVTDRELAGIVNFAIAKNPKPSGFGNVSAYPSPPRRQSTPAFPKVTPEEATANAERWLNGFRCDSADLYHASPWVPLEDWRVDSLTLLCAAYGQAEHVNIVTDYTTVEKDGAAKANLKGAGITMLRDDWLRHIREHGTPQSEAGAWVRMNPVLPCGTGYDGAVTDADVTAHRFMLIESDVLPPEIALSVYARLPLPVFAIVDSAGRGPHCWLKLDCADAESYHADVAHILGWLAKLGIDQGNKNPSRLSRLPGAKRMIGAHGDGEQRLYYLNDEPALEKPIFPK